MGQKETSPARSRQLQSLRSNSQRPPFARCRGMDETAARAVLPPASGRAVSSPDWTVERSPDENRVSEWDRQRERRSEKKSQTRSRPFVVIFRSRNVGTRPHPPVRPLGLYLCHVTKQNNQGTASDGRNDGRTRSPYTISRRPLALFTLNGRCATSPLGVKIILLAASSCLPASLPACLPCRRLLPSVNPLLLRLPAPVPLTLCPSVRPSAPTARAAFFITRQQDGPTRSEMIGITRDALSLSAKNKAE